MLAYLAENIGTIVVGLIVAGILAAIIAKLVRDKKNGKCIGCDCGCGVEEQSCCHK
jgi:1-aminocyclopropane-1-carboxylate deaminase/D-cysteine desulfhydrase-like pyridoxal-dependent ACC family enzyme